MPLLEKRNAAKCVFFRYLATIKTRSRRPAMADSGRGREGGTCLARVSPASLVAQCLRVALQFGGQLQLLPEVVERKEVLGGKQGVLLFGDVSLESQEAAFKSVSRHVRSLKVSMAGCRRFSDHPIFVSNFGDNPETFKQERTRRTGKTAKGHYINST